METCRYQFLGFNKEAHAADVVTGQRGFEMAAYLGGGSGSGDTHVSRMMSGGKMAKGGSGAGGTKGATPAAKSAGKAVTKATPASKKAATKTGTRSVSKGTDASKRTGQGRKMGGQRQGGAGFPGNQD